MTTSVIATNPLATVTTEELTVILAVLGVVLAGMVALNKYNEKKYKKINEMPH